MHFKSLTMTIIAFAVYAIAAPTPASNAIAREAEPEPVSLEPASVEAPVGKRAYYYYSAEDAEEAKPAVDKRAYYYYSAEDAEEAKPAVDKRAYYYYSAEDTEDAKPAVDKRAYYYYSAEDAEATEEK